MGKAKGKHRLDKYYHLAKEQGYRSRAAFKLLQLDAKFRFLSSSRSLLDLCAAPGSWLQVAAARAPVGSFLLGVDLVPIRPLRGALSIAADITTPACRASIKRLMSQHGCAAFDVVLHDGSPNVGGRWAQEATGQAALVVDSIKLATEFLAPKGTFVSKVFRSQDYTAILFCLKQLFEKVEVTKPVASRSTSAEIYVVGLKYKAPAKIDPRLLDVKHLFQGVIEPPKVTDVLKGTKQKRNRDGYEDGMSTVRKVCLASDFVWSETPLEVLGSVTSITFDDPACSPMGENPLTTEEIKYLCDDLRVLGKQDFKLLLKWRMQIRKALSSKQKNEPETDAMEKGTTEVDEDDRLLKEMEDLSIAMMRKKKRAKKLLAKRRAKDKIRKGTGNQNDFIEDYYQDHELFSLGSIRKKKDLQAVGSVDADGNDDDELGESEAEEHPKALAKEDFSSDADSDEEHRRYDEHLEDFLNEAYERFVTRKGGSTQQRKRAKSRANDDEQLWEEDGENAQIYSDPDSDEDAMDDEANPLMVSLHDGEKPTEEQVTEKWFSQDIFAEAVDEDAFEKIENDEDVGAMLEEKSVIPEKSKETPVSNELNGSRNRNSQLDDFEIVPAEASDTSDSSSSSEESDIDDDEKAKILAYGKKMLRKKQREQILDDAYNRYMFDDTGLPKWFVEDEKKHNQPLKPVTKEEIAAMKAQFREIDARPAKKVAQAKARRKRAAMRQLDKARRKANAISDQTDISDRSKSRMIEQLYKKAAPKRPKKEFVVAKKGVQVKGGKGKVVVDRRMKKDARSRGIGRHGKGSSKKGKSVTGKTKKRASKGKGSGNGNKGKKMKMSE